MGAHGDGVASWPLNSDAVAMKRDILSTSSIVDGAPDIHKFLRSMMANGEITDADTGEQHLSKVLRKSFKADVSVPV